jgi:hypothetical protein
MSADTPTRDFMETPLEDSSVPPTLLTLSELAYLAETSPEIIEQLLELDIMEPASGEPEPCFTVETLFLVRRLLRINAGLGIDFPSLPLVLDLLNRIADLEQRLSKADRSDSR